MDLLVAQYVTSRQNVISLRELEALGGSERAARVRVKAGRWQRMHRGVYFVGVGRPGPLARYRAATLAVPASWLSHRSAASLHGIQPHHGGPVHVTTSGHAKSRRGIEVHRSRLPKGHSTLHGIPCADLHETLTGMADLSASEAEMERAIREAERLGYQRGAPALPGRRNVTGGTYAHGELIHRLLYVIEVGGLEPPDTEYPLLGYRIDAAWPHVRLAVEVDDYETHVGRSALDRDTERDRVLTLNRWRPFRVTATAIGPALVPQFIALGVRVTRAG